MSEFVQSLESHWEFREVLPAEKTSFASREHPPSLAEENWIPARVPGCVHLDLMRANQIQDPFVGLNEKDCQWVENEDWVYRTSFVPDPQWLEATRSAGRRVELNFESLETFASVYLNGELLGESQDQFLPVSFDITKKLRTGDNYLVVHFESAVQHCRHQEKTHGRLRVDFDHTRVYARRMQMLTGWDVAPRLSGCGIMGPVTIEHVNQARLRFASVQINRLSNEIAHFSIETDLEGLGEREVELRWRVDHLDPTGSGENYAMRVVWESERTFPMREGTFRCSEPITIERPVLWWPAGFGAGRRPLYRATVRAFVDGVQIDELETTFGLRTVELANDVDQAGESFGLKINGLPIFVRGANWIPPDVFPPRQTSFDMEEWVEMAAVANINLLRVWAGGNYESDDFYRLCDEHGIMVWQDFMFAHGEYPDHKDFWRILQREATHQIRRLRNHPSLVLWCGSDEIEKMMGGSDSAWRRQQGTRILTKLLPHLLSQYDPSRPYWISTPHGGEDPNSPEEGDYHEWDVWTGWESPDRYRQVRPRFVTEFGFQSLPSEACVSEFTTEEDKTLNHPELEAHQKQKDGNIRLFRYVIGSCRPPESFEEMIYLSQWVQADALSLAIDAWRANKPHTMGAIVWHMNDCWPAISWSLVDYRRRPKLAYWAVRQAFMPTALMLLPSEEGLRAVALHDGAPWEAKQELLCRLKAYDLEGRLLDWRDQTIVLEPNAKLEIGHYTLRSLGIQNPAASVVVGELIRGKAIIASKLFSPVEPRKAPYHEPELTCYLDCILANRRAVFLIHSTNVVRGVELQVVGLKNGEIKHENAFDIWPKREVWVQADIPPGTSRDELRDVLRFRCLNDSVEGRNVHWRPLPVQPGEGRAKNASIEAPIVQINMKTSDLVPKLND
ncbi:hypothetical protein KQI84_15525 [bacterium]|nr:hypothetical protein [bacterium]